MKKILIVFCAFMLAVGVQAASVDWKVTGTANEANYTIYLIVGETTTTTWASVSDIAAAAVGTGTIVKGNRNYVSNGTATDTTLTKNSKFYYVIVSADKLSYAVSDIYDGSSFVYDTSAEPPEVAPSVAPVFAANSVSYTAFSGGGDVPEPTSAMLLLLGMAGLALRRKVA